MEDSTLLKSNDYQQSVVIATDEKKAFQAITKQVSDWWGKVDKPISKTGDVFKITFGEAFWVFKVIKYDEPKELAWECIESHQVHNGLEGIEEEWLGTKLCWNIFEIGEGQVKIDFVHEGLVPDFICYDICSSAWDFFITDSLKNYLEGKKGTPEL